MRVLSKKSILVVILAIFMSLVHSGQALAVTSADYLAEPPFVNSGAPPLIMLVMGRNHKLYYEAYNDASDLNEDGELDVGYNPDINYYGYFDSYKCYEYRNNRFEPTCDSNPDTKTCSGDKWSGDFLNYLTMSRMDCLRKVLYGGRRSTDTADETVLERAFIPQDAHSWGKEYKSEDHDGYDIADYTPFNEPNSGRRHLFASTTLNNPDSWGNYNPLLRIGLNSNKRIWEWVAKESPVCDDTVHADYDLTVRVQVGECSKSDSSGLYSGAKVYPNATCSKPVGLLQRYGEDGRMDFGLISGSYTNNVSGGVLRKNMGSITDEIDPTTGVFTDTEGIIYTIDEFRIIDYHNDDNYDGGWPDAWYVEGPMSEVPSKFPDWGNPIGEMLYEALNYFAGESPTTAFTYSGDDVSLDLPQPAWEDPYNASNFCAQPYILNISDIYPTFDSDELPGSRWGSMSSEYIGNAAERLDVEDIGDEIFAEEFGGNQERFIGCSGTSVGDFSCSPKIVESFGDIRGLCPEEPTKQGSYYSASVAKYGFSQDLSFVDGNQTVRNYMVGLASPLPTIEIPVGGETITVVPFGKSVKWTGGSGIDPDSGYQPTNTIVDYFIEDISDASGTFRINFEDVEQGADHDMDAIVKYSYQVVDSNENPVSNPEYGDKVRITVTSESASGGIIQHMGYIISGTENDGTYLVVRDADTGENEDPDYFLDKPLPWNDGSPLPFTSTMFFTPKSENSASNLKNPLWYAAKWGNFDDLDGNGIPDRQEEWDKDGDGIPDAYFYVQNPLRLEQQLNKAFTEILKRTASGTSISSLTEKTTSGSLVNQAVFYPEKKFDGEHKVNWLGYLYTYWFLNKEGAQNLREDTEQNMILDIEEDYILEFLSSSDGIEIRAFNSTSEGVKDEPVNTYPNMDAMHPLWEAGEKLRNRNSTDRNVYGVAENGTLGNFTVSNRESFDAYFGNNTLFYPNCLNGTTPNYADLIRYVRGEDIEGCRSRQTGNGTWKLGDIIYSTPVTVSYDDYSMVYVAANDGMLHAFRLGLIKEVYSASRVVKLCQSRNDCSYEKLGREEWAFIPKDVMPYLRFQAEPDYSHMYVHDLKPFVVEYEDNDGHMKKVLIGGMRLGGGTENGNINPPSDTDPVGRSGYYALDITDPQNPQYLWSFSPDGMGFSYSGPAYVKRKDENGDWKRYLMFASGPTGYDGTSIQNLEIYTVDMAGGPGVYNSTFGDETSEMNIKNAYGGRLFSDGLDVNDDGQTDFVLLGYTNKADGDFTKMSGGIIKIYTGSDNPDEWEYDTSFLTTSIGNPVTAPVVSMDCFAKEIDFPYIYFGTGRYFVPRDETYSSTGDLNYLYGVPFTCNATNEGCSGINNINDSSDLDCSDINAVNSSPNRGAWKIPLSGPTGCYFRERSYSTPSPTEHDIIFFNTAMPNAEICGYGGQSRSWAVNCASGWSLLDDSCSGFTVDVSEFNFLVQLSTGAIKQYSLSDFTEEGGRATPFAEGMVSEEGGVTAFPSSSVFKILYWREW